MSTPLTTEQLAAIRAHHATVTDYAPAPWRWGGSLEAARPDYYLATDGHGRKYVMGARKAGFSGAELNFPVVDPETGWGLLARGREIAVRERPYRDQIGDIDNPFAEYLKRAPEYIGALLADRDRLAAELAEHAPLADAWMHPENELTTEIRRRGKQNTALTRANTEAHRELEQARQQLDAVRKFSAAMRGYCSPHGVSLHYADQLDAVLDATPAAPVPAPADGRCDRCGKPGCKRTCGPYACSESSPIGAFGSQSWCELVEGHGGNHQEGDYLWAPDAGLATAVPGYLFPATESWREYTVERDSSDDGVSVLCREDGDCLVAAGNARNWLSLAWQLWWAKRKAGRDES